MMANRATQTEVQEEAPQGKRAQAKAANREMILAAARDVFAEMGYETASVRDIIRATPLASGTFYNYFRSKEEVFEALTDDSIERFRPLLQAVRENATDFSGYVRGAYLAFFEFTAAEHRDPGLTSVRLDTPGFQAIFEEIRDDIKAAHRRGEIPDTDIGYFTAVCIGIARDVADRMLRRSPVDPGYAADFCARTLLALRGL